MSRRLLLPILGAIALCCAACLPMPPHTFNAHQFPAGVGPSVNRAVVFQGLGAWMDVYDWSPTVTGGAPPLGPGSLAGMAKAGVQTLYLQTAKSNRPETLLDQGTALAIISRAHSLGIRVVGWYLPTHVDLNVDYARLAAITTLGVDGIAVDIESQAQPDIAVRNDYLLRISSALRQNYPAMPLGAITMTPVLLNQINPYYWPNFPWTELVKYYDVFMPMAYSTTRGTTPQWLNAYNYVAASVNGTRAATGVAWLPVHPIGGLAAGMSPADVAAMNQAMHDTYAIGGSLYDANSTPANLWPTLRSFRR